MRALGSVVTLLLILGVACPSLAADIGIGKGDFLKRFNAHGSQAGLPSLPAKPVQENKQQDGSGPFTISVYPIGSLVVMLRTYDSKPGTLAGVGMMNQLGGPPENDVATAIAVDSLLAALLPKTQSKERGAIKKALGLDKGVKGAVADGKKREQTAGNIRFASNAKQGRSITVAAYPAKR